MKNARRVASVAISPSQDWQRARRPEHRAERRDAILGASLSLLDEAGVEGTTLSEIARRAGLSKANCYRYFESREAILLTVMIREAERWAGSMVERLASMSGTSDVEGVARICACTIAERPRLSMLISSLSSVLERNVSEEAIAEFKRTFHSLSSKPVEAIRAAVPELSNDQVEAFLSFLGLTVAAAWPRANPAPAVAKVLARREFASMRVDFERTLFAHAFVLLRGFLAEPNARACESNSCSERPPDVMAMVDSGKRTEED